MTLAVMTKYCKVIPNNKPIKSPVHKHLYAHNYIMHMQIHGWPSGLAVGM